MKFAGHCGFKCTVSLEVVILGAKIHYLFYFRLKLSPFNSILLAFAIRRQRWFLDVLIPFINRYLRDDDDGLLAVFVLDDLHKV